MDSTAMISLVISVASIGFAVVTFVWSYKKDQLSELKNEIGTLYRDIQFFYNEEEFLLRKLSEKTGENLATLKINTREEVSKPLGGYKPSDYAKPSKFQKEIN